MAEQDQVKEAQVDDAQTAEGQGEKIEPIRMATSAIAEVASFLNQKIVECIGKLEFYERARLSGAPVPTGLVEYDSAKLRDLNVLRDSLTSVFYYKRLDKEEAGKIADRYAELVKQQAEQPPSEQPVT